ncbi:hypothetical protein I4U23_010689 [Adineta vaga]|nr:hypothetical protein I4U23_010689 [Adineta vaga]
MNQESVSNPLEHDLTQLNLNDNTKSTENIEREQSISPRLPVDSHDDDEQLYSFSPSTEYKLTDQSLNISNQTNISQPISSTTSSEIDTNNSILYGVNWNNHAHPTSHCWFPAASDDLSTGQSCAYHSCTNFKSPLLHCESCGLIVHSHHLNDSETTAADFPPPCRLSFVDGKDNPSEYDQHYWYHVRVLPKPCTFCQRTSTATTLISNGIDQLSTMSAADIAGQFTSIMTSRPGNFLQKMSESSSGIVCLWCSQGFHQLCWERFVARGDKIQCDYGIFRNIIVRPQWLSRSTESVTGFRARLTENNSFPYTPILFFINKRSGGQVGEKIYRQLLGKLNPRQVFLLENNDTITQALDIYSSLPNLRICVFGGDGTVGWVLSRLAETYPERKNPPVGICPLGTGNDLSRVLNWGGEYNPKQLFRTLLRIPQAEVVVLDRWKVELEKFDASKLISSDEENRENQLSIVQTFQSLFKHSPKFINEIHRNSYEKYHELPNTHFINYMSFGLDAAIALDFHDQRTLNPSKFSSPIKNKFMYLNESCKYLDEFTRANMWKLRSYIRLICDGEDLTHSIRDCHTLVILNIPGYAAGTNPWGNLASIISGDIFECITPNNFDQQNFGDRKIEVVGLTTAHMAAIHVGFRGSRIAQCNQLRIELCYPMTAQIDGEPFYLPSSIAVNISHADQILIFLEQSFSNTYQNIIQLVCRDSKRGHDAIINSLGSPSNESIIHTTNEIKEKYSSSTLIIEQFDQLVEDFISAVESDTLKTIGYTSKIPLISYYISKTALIALSQIETRQWSNEKKIFIYSLCPGYCNTDLSKHTSDSRSVEFGADSILYFINTNGNLMILM